MTITIVAHEPASANVPDRRTERPEPSGSSVFADRARFKDLPPERRERVVPSFCLRLILTEIFTGDSTTQLCQIWSILK
jgi:hypothetical protein